MPVNEFLQDAREIVEMIAEEGNPVTIVSSGKVITAGTIDRADKLRKIVGQGFLDQAMGRVAVFLVRPADAALILPGGFVIWDGEEFVTHLQSKKTAGGVPLYVILVGQSVSALFPHLCNVYTAPLQIGPTLGKPVDPVWTLKQANVPCFYNYTQNVDDAAGIARLKRASFFTRDTISMPYTVNVGDGDALINVTVKPDGTATTRFGEVHIVQGAPKFTHPTDLLPYGYLELQGMTDDQPASALVTIAKAIPHTGRGLWN